MSYRFCSNNELEQKAEELNSLYDANRLIVPSKVDIYDLVDLIGARLAFEYISPDRSLLGATTFRTGSIYVWPGYPYSKDMKPELKLFYDNTIIVDRGLAESKDEQDCNKLNFTVSHEGCHLLEHREFFTDECHESSSLYDYKEECYNDSPIKKIEHEANFMAAAFLMPREAVFRVSRRLLCYRNKVLPFGYGIKDDIKEMAHKFGVNYTPMEYRLQYLGILDKEFDSSI